MAEEIKLPSLGESVTEGTVTSWLKKIGDKIEIDEPIVEVSTDKVDTEVPSPVQGILQKILVQEDETVEVGAVLAIIETDPNAVVSAEPANEAQAAQESSLPDSPPAADISSRVSQDASQNQASFQSAYAAESNISISPKPAASQAAQTQPAASASSLDAASASEVLSNTEQINISRESYITPILRKYAKDLHVDIASVLGTGIGGRIIKEDIEAASKPKAGAYSPSPQDVASTESPLKDINQYIADNIPSSTFFAEADITDILIKQENISILSYIISSAAKALKIYGANNPNIAFASPKTNGATPVLSDIENKQPNEINSMLLNICESGIKPENIKQADIVINDLSDSEILYCAPSLSAQNIGTIAFGKINKTIKVAFDGISESIATRDIITLGFSFNKNLISDFKASELLSNIIKHIA